jgi:hypothetical protein
MQSAHSGAIRPPPPLGSAMLTFDLNAEIKRLRNEDAWQAGRNSKTTGQARRFSDGPVSAETRSTSPRTQGRRQDFCTDRCGSLRGKVFDLPAEHLQALEGALPHNVKASEDTAPLLTICLPDDAKTTERHGRAAVPRRTKAND